MRRIALICSFGLSTSLLVQSMEREAVQKELDIEVSAIGTSELADTSNTVDIFMLAPQVRYMFKTVEKYGKPVGIVDGMTYATADGAKVLKQALLLLEAEENQ